MLFVRVDLKILALVVHRQGFAQQICYCRNLRLGTRWLSFSTIAPTTPDRPSHPGFRHGLSCRRSLRLC